MDSPFPLRRVPFDFHASPHIPGVGFDPSAFAATFKRACVNSVTTLAKCHPGQCCYPTATRTPHPALAGHDGLGVQIEAPGWRDGQRFPPMRDDVASVAYWYQPLLAAPFPAYPDKDSLEVI